MTQQRALETAPAPWEGPTPLELCTEYYPTCAMLCDATAPYPGTPGYCCSSPVDRTTCTEARIYGSGPDSDQDGYADAADNCPRAYNPDQANADGDRWGDACDNCPNTPSDDLSDHDGDDIGSVCDDDDDNDGILDVNDLCPTLPLPKPPYSTASHYNDNDGDGMGDACDPDDDNDGLRDIEDNCDFVPNPLQSDHDRDHIGDKCDSDIAVDSVLLQRVRHRLPGSLATVLTNPDYVHWDNAGLNQTIQLRTFLARYSDPPREKVEHLVFVSAGQQGFTPTGTNWSTLTGQTSAYKDGFSEEQGSKNVSLRRANGLPTSNLVRDLIRRREVTTANTFIGAAFDAHFNWEHPVWDRDLIVEAYYRWLESQFDPANIRSIFLAGHSRGGCLVARVARRFQQDYPNVPLIVQLYDPVCNAANFEFGIGAAPTEQNPLDSAMAAHPLSFENAYSTPAGTDHRNLRIWNILSGAEVLDTDVPTIAALAGLAVFGLPIVVPKIRAFAQPNGVVQHTDAVPGVPGGVTWFEQEWVALGHMGVEFQRATTTGFTRYQTACQSLGGVCAD